MSTTQANALPFSARPAPTETYAKDEDPFLFRRARTWWTLLALFLMAQGNGLFTKQDETYWSLRDLNQQYDSKPTLFWLTALLWIISLLLMVKGLGPTLQLAWKQKALLAFAGLAFASVLWSQDPRATLNKAILWFLAFAFAWFFATYYSPEDQIRLFLAAGVIVGIACIAMALLLPQYGISSDGQWKGIFSHKNRMGLGILFLFSGLPFRRISSLRDLVKLGLQALLPLGLILLSQSRTALILVVVLVAIRIVGPYIASRRREQLPFVIYCAMVGLPALALLSFAFKDSVLQLLGKESTMSGRTDHWAVLLPYIYRHLWLGYGFAGFWNGTGDALTVITMIGGAMKGSDSGYVDTMLQLGLVGLGFVLLILLVSVWDFMCLFRLPSVPLVAYWYFGIILATFVGSLTEILFLSFSGPSAFIFVLACAGLKNLDNGVRVLNRNP
jgi:exopolysaccharide production protein ExoQ